MFSFLNPVQNVASTALPILHGLNMNQNPFGGENSGLSNQVRPLDLNFRQHYTDGHMHPTQNNVNANMPVDLSCSHPSLGNDESTPQKL